MLVLGERKIDGGEFGEPRGTAVLPATPPDAADAGRLVAHADLAHVDAGAEGAGELAHEGPEINSLLGGEIHGELVPVPLPLDRHMPC